MVYVNKSDLFVFSIKKISKFQRLKWVWSIHYNENTSTMLLKVTDHVIFIYFSPISSNAHVLRIQTFH